MAFLFTDETKEGSPRPHTLLPRAQKGGAAFTGRKRDERETFGGKKKHAGGGRRLRSLACAVCNVEDISRSLRQTPRSTLSGPQGLI